MNNWFKDADRDYNEYKWIKTADRLPTEEDRDYSSNVWVILNDGSITLRLYYSVRDYNVLYWMPTGLKQPVLPEDIQQEVAPMTAGQTLRCYELEYYTLGEMEALAQELGVDEAEFSDMLCGVTYIDRNLAEKIENYFGMSADILMRMEEKHKKWKDSGNG